MFSGGLDSEVLVRTALDVLGRENVLVMSTVSPLLADFWKTHINDVGKELGIDIELIPTAPLAIEELRNNSKSRCYHCKNLMYSTISRTARAEGYDTTADGTLKSDMSEDRPGLRAAKEEGIFHPFTEAGMNKKEVTELGKSLGIDNPFPSDSCLATRIDRKLTLTPERLLLIDRLEAPLRPFAKGRFRMMFDGVSINAEYAGIDRDLINSKRKLLVETAEHLGYEITFEEKEIESC